MLGLGVVCGAVLALAGCLGAAPPAMPAPTSGDAANAPPVGGDSSSAAADAASDPGAAVGDGPAAPIQDLGAGVDLHGADAASVDAGPGIPSCAGTIFCDNFESYTGKPGGSWTVSNGAPGSSLVVDTTRPYSGTRSVHVKSGAVVPLMGGDDISMKSTTGLPAAGNHVFGRMMMYLKGPWPTTHVRVMGMPNPTPAPQGYVLDAHNNWSLEALVDIGGNGGQLPIVTDKWTCVEWEFNAPASAAVTTRLWIAGTEVLPAPVGFPHVDMLEFWVGYSTARTRPLAEMWIDDVALSTKRVGCQ
jgi:hypothetical protein